MYPQELAERIRDRVTTSKNTLDTVAIIGLGYVGLPLAILTAERGYETVGYDIDEVKIAQLEKREANFLSTDETQAFKEARKLAITSDERQLDAATVFIICVPTPVHENHEPDLHPLKGAAETVGRHLKRGDMVVVESTVNPGVCESVALPVLERISGLHRDEFDFAHCPERINPGDARWDVRSIPRVLGARTPRALVRASALYSKLVDGKIKQMGSIKEAEAVKMVENSFRDINIAFVNELAMAFDKAGIDIVNVLDGASTKPFGFMAHYPGCGVGGHCIPVDPYYLIRYGVENGFEHRFLATARRINERMPAYTVSLLEDALEEKGKKLAGSTIALLGLAYKKDVPDVRESPALVIEKILKERGARVRAYDPYAMHAGNVRSIDAALTHADACIIATDHSLIRTLSPEQFMAHGVYTVVDGRNCLDKKAFMGSQVSYRGIGRSV